MFKCSESFNLFKVFNAFNAFNAFNVFNRVHFLKKTLDVANKLRYSTVT